MRAMITLFALLLTGCQLPQWRVLQAKVPASVKKPERQVEAERSAADLIARRIEEPAELKPVAATLSASLGAPANPIVTADVVKASADADSELRASIAELQKQVAKQNALLDKYAGKEIEGTGFNLFGPSMGVVVIGLIALGVLCPPAMTLMFFVLKRVRSAAGYMAQSIEAANAEHPDAVKAIKEGVKDKMVDPAKRALIRKLKVNHA